MSFVSIIVVLLFYEDLCKDKPMAEKNALAAKARKQLTPEEQLSYKEIAQIKRKTKIKYNAGIQ
jgi:hypothetical protein